MENKIYTLLIVCGLFSSINAMDKDNRNGCLQKTPPPVVQEQKQNSQDITYQPANTNYQPTSSDQTRSEKRATAIMKHLFEIHDKIN